VTATALAAVLSVYKCFSLLAYCTVRFAMAIKIAAADGGLHLILPETGVIGLDFLLLIARIYLYSK